MGQADCSSQDTRYYTPVAATEATFASEEVSDPMRTVMPPMWCLCHPAPCGYVICSINSHLPEPAGTSFGANLVTTDTVLMDNHDGGSYMKSADND
jgi:hypothetical protein